MSVIPGMLAQQGGTSGYKYLDVTGSARIFGLGGTNVSIVDADDVSTTDQNPALLGPEMSRGLALSYMRYVGQTNFADARYVGAAGENGAWSLHLHYYGYGSIKHTNADGVTLGTISPSDLAIGGSFAYNLGEKLRGGASVKMLYSNYFTASALAIATDLGLNWYDEDWDSSIGLVVANLGGQVKKFTDRGDKMPVDLRLGWSKRLADSPFNLSLTAANLLHWHMPYYGVDDATQEIALQETFASNLFRHLIAGVEWRPSERFYIDVAYNYRQKTDMRTFARSFLSGFSLGSGLKVRNFNVGVAYANSHPGAASLMLSIGTNLWDF